MKKETSQSNQSTELRRQAEAALRDQATDVSQLSADDLQRLVHELQVRQVELEIQNEELRQAQEKLAASKAEYADLYDFAPVGYFTLDRKCIILQANLTGADLLGAPRNELLQTPLSRFVAEESQDEFYQHCRLVLEDGKKHTSEIVLKKPDGSVLNAQLESTAVPDADGRSSYIHTIISNITEQIQAMVAVLAGEQKYHQIIEALQEGIWVIDKDANTTFVNQPMADMLGYTVDDMLGRHLFSYMSETAVADAQRKLNRRQEGINEQHDFEFLRRDGSPIYTTIVTASIFDGEGNYDGAVAGVIDITNRRRQEKQLARLNSCFLNFGPDPITNINQLTALCGELLTADCALYNRLHQGMLCSWGQWQTPPAYNPEDNPEGHICYDVIQEGSAEAVIIRNLKDTIYATTDPTVLPFDLQTYIGKAIQVEGETVGSLCVVFKHDFEPAAEDLQILEIIGAAIVIEERRRATEVSLKAIQEHLEATLDALPDLMFEVDRDGRFSDFRAPNPDILYVPPEIFLGKTAAEVLPAETAAIIMDAIEAAADLGQHTSAVYSLDMPDGRHWFETSIALRGDGSGQDGRFIALARDITKRQQAEEALRKSRRLFAALTEQSREGIGVADTNGNYVLVNDAFCKMTGYTQAELLDMNVRDLVPKGIELKLFPRLVRGQSGERNIQLQRKDGSRFYAGISGAPIDTGSEQLALGIVRDITEQMEAEAALRQSHQHLETALAELRETQTQMVQQERLAAVGQMAAGIAHDFNNLMATIILYSEIMLNTSQLPPEEQEKVRIIHNEGHRAANLTQQILDFSRKSILEKKELDLVVFLPDLISLLGRTLPENIQLTFISEPQAYWVKVDATRLEQVIMNLAINARDAMPNGGRLTIGLSHLVVAESDQPHPLGLTTGKWNQVSVSDTGSGIDPEIIPRIFEPFFTTKAPKGSGLGLSQVYGIIKQFGGEVNVISKVDAGTTFTIFLPAVQAIKPDLEPGELLTPIVGNGETLLVVEDDERLREALIDSLQALNYQVISVLNGREALEIYPQKKDEIALILSDLIMPDMGGLELVQTLNQQYPQLKVLIISGYPFEDIKADLRKAGVTYWLQKPIDLNSLGRMVSGILEEGPIT